ncbi:probable N-acetyltransferase HLS1 [Phalaenopsis equestris]|uniref:probable N-acetyltransferase HLS1 n=1 Tax=Phalaenopsis equestris TaxID=78828 RepID=UPI0009E1BD1D|nr:probable N-acetyltransferase HLS1 [Phalaenopsis equestris]
MITEQARKMQVIVREYEAEKDLAGAEAVELSCEVGQSGAVSIFTDLLGDPTCRVRHSPAFLMLVAETVGPKKEIVGLIRGCVKTITCGKRAPRPAAAAAAAVAIYTKAACIVGLRVSPRYRRMGVGLQLVQQMEDWFRSHGAEYAYMATDKDNEASLSLFTGRCGYTKFRTPSLLVQPVFAGHRLPLRRTAIVIHLSPADAETLYRRRLSTVEFFPRDIDSILRNPLSLGTFLALPSGYSWANLDSFLAKPPDSWAVLSIWDTKSLFRLEVRGVSLLRRVLAWTTRVLDRSVPWLRIPSFPNIFRPFGGYFLYGLGGEGPSSASLMRVLCSHAHNMARAGGCGIVATEVTACEPFMPGIPYWQRLSIDKDFWCIKRLAEDYSDGAVGDWTRSAPASSIFVDPREV